MQRPIIYLWGRGIYRRWRPLIYLWGPGSEVTTGGGLLLAANTAEPGGMAAAHSEHAGEDNKLIKIEILGFLQISNKASTEKNYCEFSQ